MFTHPLQTVIKGPAYLRRIPYSFDFWPGGPASFLDQLFKLGLVRIRENSSNIVQVTLGVNGDVATVGLTDHRVRFLDDRTETRYVKVLVDQVE